MDQNWIKHILIHTGIIRKSFCDVLEQKFFWLFLIIFWASKFRNLPFSASIRSLASLESEIELQWDQKWLKSIQIHIRSIREPTCDVFERKIFWHFLVIFWPSKFRNPSIFTTYLVTKSGFSSTLGYQKKIEVRYAHKKFLPLKKV